MDNDLISKQEVLNDLSEPFVMSQCLTVEECETMNRARKLCLARVERIEPAQRWIPVTERLPEPYSGEYLVTINDGSVYTDVLWFDSPGDGRYVSCFYKTDDDGYGVVCDDVVAWMPLPEPYKK